MFILATFVLALPPVSQIPWQRPHAINRVMANSKRTKIKTALKTQSCFTVFGSPTSELKTGARRSVLSWYRELESRPVSVQTMKGF